MQTMLAGLCLRAKTVPGSDAAGGGLICGEGQDASRPAGKASASPRPPRLPRGPLPEIRPLLVPPVPGSFASGTGMKA